MNHGVFTFEWKDNPRNPDPNELMASYYAIPAHQVYGLLDGIVTTNGMLVHWLLDTGKIYNLPQPKGQVVLKAAEAAKKAAEAE